MAPFGHARLLFSKSHDGKGANGSKNRLHDAYHVRCRVPDYYGPSSERVCDCQLEKYWQLEESSRATSTSSLRPTIDWTHLCLRLQEYLAYKTTPLKFRNKSDVHKASMVQVKVHFLRICSTTNPPPPITLVTLSRRLAELQNLGGLSRFSSCGSRRYASGCGVGVGG